MKSMGHGVPVQSSARRGREGTCWSNHQGRIEAASLVLFDEAWIECQMVRDCSAGVRVGGILKHPRL